MNLNKVIEELLEENTKLKTMFEEVHANEIETKELKNKILKKYHVLHKENHELKEQIIELKTKLYDSNVKEQRLLKILNETDDYT